MQLLRDHLFKDKEGHVVLWQMPNLPLWGWIIIKLLELFISKGQFKTGLDHLGTAAIFAWAYLELTKGVNYFRKALGAVVLALTILQFFKK